MEQIRYRFLRVIRNRANMFWGFLYPVILATFMFFAFGQMDSDSFSEVPVAVVASDEEGGLATMLREVTELVHVHEMTKTQAEEALAAGEVRGIYYDGAEPTLTVGGNGPQETILAMLLDAYYKNRQVFTDLYVNHHAAGIDPVTVFRERTKDEFEVLKETGFGGRTHNTALEYFFACMAMACFFGSFNGADLAEEFAANLSALGARRSISPAHKFPALLIDLFVSLIVQAVSVLLLLLYMQYVLRISFSGNLFLTFLICVAGSLVGISFGMLVGASVRLHKTVKMGLIICVPLFSCFLAGLMYGGMKQQVEKTLPIVNRINPSALISDALYYLNVYDDVEKMWMRLFTLCAIAAVLTVLSFAVLWRTRYESI